MSWWGWLLGLNDTGTLWRVLDALARPANPVPLVILILFALLGLAAAGINLLPGAMMPWRLRLALVVIRLAGFALAILMLIQIEVRLTYERRLPPHVALLVDASGSMGITDVEGKSRIDAARTVEETYVRALDDTARVSRYAFSWRLSSDVATASLPGATRIAGSLDDLLKRESDLQAVVLLTDGNDTGDDRGQRVAPLLIARGAPVYPVVFGRKDSPPRAEVRIQSGPPYVRLGDEFTLSVTLTAEGLEEQTARVLLYEQGEKEPLVVRENVGIGKEAVSVAFAVKPIKAGEAVYRIVLEGVQGGSSDSRLVAEHTVQVVDAKIRVLYLDIPRDERKLIGHWLARDPVVDLATLTLLPKGGWYGQGALRHKDVGEGLPGKEEDLYQYDVILLGDIPRSYFRQGGDSAETKLHWIVEFVARRGGGLVTLGGNSVYGAGNYQGSALARVLPFELDFTGGNAQVPSFYTALPTPLGFIHPILQFEADAEANREAWEDLPTLDGCNAVGSMKPGAFLLATRPVEGGQLPLLALQEAGKGKVLSLTADTTWRWEMVRDDVAPDRFRRFWGNVVRYLAPDPRLEPGRPGIVRARTNPAVGETLAFSTRLLDAVYRPVRGGELVVSVTAPSGRVTAIYPRDGRNKPGVYEYEVTLDGPGSWVLEATYKDQKVRDTVQVGVSDEEMDDPRARPDRMEELAAATGGRVLRPDQVDDLITVLAATPRLVQETAVIPLWNLPLTLVLFLTLVGLDCWLRKRRGLV